MENRRVACFSLIGKFCWKIIPTFLLQHIFLESYLRSRRINGSISPFLRLRGPWNRRNVASTPSGRTKNYYFTKSGGNDRSRRNKGERIKRAITTFGSRQLFPIFPPIPPFPSSFFFSQTPAFPPEVIGVVNVSSTRLPRHALNALPFTRIISLGKFPRR